MSLCYDHSGFQPKEYLVALHNQFVSSLSPREVVHIDFNKLISFLEEQKDSQYAIYTKTEIAGEVSGKSLFIFFKLFTDTYDTILQIHQNYSDDYFDEDCEIDCESRIEEHIYRVEKLDYVFVDSVEREIFSKKIVADFWKKMLENCRQEIEKTRCIYLIEQYGPRLDLEAHEIKKVEAPDLNLYYEEGFVNKHERIKANLQDRKKTGILILHGEPGTGKTQYIRYLIDECKDLDFVFFPQHILANATNPELMSFLSEHKNLVLIIEESEEVVQNREEFGTNKSSVANLLNLTDGLLSDVLNCKVIVTFNTDIKNLDKALLRPGRLLGIHKFRKLSPEQATQIAQEKGIDKSFETPSTLAEIFNKTLKSDFSGFEEKPPLGFRT